ncbi:MAG: class I adenylate cyclase [Methylobacter sp.]|nr:class I adenylate cyclase [Methylobacter sp.]MDP2429066.1 class I adenylate cyclase [Methylobacter sp.]MDP3054501.1 class I adenylate cyclase [Methylobacter sp.]MDP3362378.1 class I adenylate cyclase [Methylobacter sp.]MDZ4218948.1 class I adenylate cyclase [Methylobacter sp.]
MKQHTEPPIHLGSPGEDISAKDLQTIKRRFKRLNQLREQRAQEFLQPRQRVFLDVLPLLFHCNFPMLPGFISSVTPAGIPEYMPSTQTLNAARQLAKNFSYTRPALRSFPIEGLFLMGSVGSIAFSKISDMDIWLCHQSNLSADAINELQKKATAIENWATSLGLEVHFFLMDSKQFRLGENAPISKESSGQTQHYLLLEEFYRTAIYIAGKSPSWWLVPPHEEQNYTLYIKHLIDNLFIPEHEVIDFGGFDAVPVEEFTSATLWHLYKALHSPHKSLLKLLLMECYASEYPQTQWLCQDIKQAVYQGDFMTTDLDPYLLIYQKVEQYLKNTYSHDRLALTRECFYLKVMGSSNNTMDSQTRAIREAYLQAIAKQCDWPENTIDNLNRLRLWDIKKATSEHATILKQLLHCHKMIMDFARKYLSPSSEGSNDIKLISRKLYSFLEKKPGKIEIITTRAEVYVKENTLSIVENCFSNDSDSGWALYLKNVQMSNAADFTPIQKCRSLIEVLCWLVINGLYHRQLQLQFSSYSLKMTHEELHLTLVEINLFFTRHLNYDPSLEAYATLNTQLNSLILVNMGSVDDGLCVMGERSDAFSYGINRQCLIESVSRVSLSSWGEITAKEDKGITGLFKCLTDIINNNKKPLSLSDLKIICHTPTRAKAISSRIESVFNTLIKLFAKPRPNRSPRYIVLGGTSFYIFQANNKIINYKELGTKKLLLNELATPQPQFSSIHFDIAVLEDTPIRLIYSLNRAQIIQLFYYESKTDTSVYIVDEKGSLYVQQHRKTTPEHVLKQYSVFLESILNRSLFEVLLNIEYYEIKKNAANVYSYTPVELKTTALNQELSLRITGENTKNGIIYTIYCNEKEFSSLDHGNKIFYVVYQHILQFRNGKSNYPIHISDIDLPLSAFGIPSPEQLQSIHYLNYKQKIEDKFNV